MDNARSQVEVIALTNCTVQQNKYSGSHKLEIVAGTRTTLLQSPKKFRIDSDTIAAPSASGSCRAVVVQSLDKIADLTVNQQVNLTGKILAVHPPEEVVAKSRGQTLTKQDFTIADCTGACRGVAWETDVGYFKTDKSYRLENVTIRTFNGAKYLSLSDKSTKQEVDEDVAGETGGAKLLKAEIVAVIGCDAYHSCRTCRSKIAETTTTIGTCTKCGMKQKLRNTSVAARLIIEDDTGTEHQVTAFDDDVIKQIITDTEGQDTTEKLLAAPCMKFTVSTQGTAASVMKLA